MSLSLQCRVQGIAVAALVAIAALALAADASAAKPGVPSGYNSGFIFLWDPLPGKGGHRVYVEGAWQKKGMEVVGSVRRGDSVAAYVGPSKKNVGLISAKLKGLGSVKLKFRPIQQKKAKIKLDHNRCPKGKKAQAVIQGGYLSGRVKIKGEGGYTKVSGKRSKLKNAWGNRFFVRLPKCAMKPRKGPKLPVGRVALEAFDSKVFVGVEGSANSSSQKRDIHAAMFERRGKTMIYRDVFYRGTTKFTHDTTDLAWGEIDAFSSNTIVKGSGRFDRIDAETSTWTGNLRADFLGKKKVSLVRPGMTAFLIRGPFQATSTLSGSSPASAPAWLNAADITPFNARAAAVSQAGFGR